MKEEQKVCVKKVLLKSWLLYVVLFTDSLLDDIVALYELDRGDTDIRICNKLTDQQGYGYKLKEMKVSFAAQVFSQRVSSVLRDLKKLGKLYLTNSLAK